MMHLLPFHISFSVFLITLHACVAIALPDRQMWLWILHTLSNLAIQKGRQKWFPAWNQKLSLCLQTRRGTNRRWCVRISVSYWAIFIKQQISYHYVIPKRAKQVNIGFTMHVLLTCMNCYVKPCHKNFNYQSLTLFQVPLCFFPSSRYFPWFSNREFNILETEQILRENFRIWPLDLMIKDTAMTFPSHISGTEHSLITQGKR